jgi:corrinoid protein of di/trimethylamine methyltransferase
MNSKSDVMVNLRKAVEDFSSERATAAAESALSVGIDPLEAIEDGLSRGLQEVGKKFADGEAFLPELIMAGEAMKAGVEVLRPAMLQRNLQRKSLGTLVIGTVRGDIHDIGKNIVAVISESAGFNVIDLGTDVAPEQFADKARQSRAEVVAMSALLTVTTPEQKNSIDALSKQGVRENVKVVVGGAAVTSNWAREIGADGYSDNAVEAVELFKRLVIAK